MANLSTIEKRKLEDLLDMGGGYVGAFSNRTFEEFFRENVEIDIYAEKYAETGGSKANRLRAFWRLEPDELVGKALSAMLEVFEYETNGQRDQQADINLVECKNIAAKLSGNVAVSEETEESFLNKNFGEISLNRLQLDSLVIPILESRVLEAQRCINAKAYLSSIFLCGSILEGVLLGIAQSKPAEFNTARACPKNSEGKAKLFREWSLAQFIDVAFELGLLQVDVKKFGHALRDFRNYIHPDEQMQSRFQPDEHTAAMCFQALKAAIAGLAGERK